MPAGPVHYRKVMEFWHVVLIGNAFVTLAFLACAKEQLSYALEFNFWSIFWYWMARYIDPDLDQPGITAAEGRMTRELGFVGVFLASYFAFYAHLMNYLNRWFKMKGGVFGAHRTKLTHSVIPGTVVRILFLNMPLPYFQIWLQRLIDFVAMLFHKAPVIIYIAPADLAIFFIAQFASLGFADWLHIKLDKQYGGE